MTQIEERVRSGLEAEAEAVAKAGRSAQRTSARRRVPWSGAGVALATAAVVLVVFGGLSLLIGGGGSVVGELATTPTSPPAADTSVPSVNEDGLFKAVPFTGETWQFTVTEEMNPSLGTYEVCFGLDPVGGALNEGAFGSPWCDDWPKSDSRLAAYLMGVHHTAPSDTSVVLVVELNDQPVDQVTIGGDGIDETVTPFVLPGSGKQFAVVEVPQTAGMLTVEALDQTGTVLDQQDGICGGDRFDSGAEFCPDWESTVVEAGTPVDDSTAAEVAAAMGGEPLSTEDLEKITSSDTQSGYLIEATTTPDEIYELGLAVYLEQSLPLAPSLLCFSPYATTKGVQVAGGSVCAQTQEKAEELAAFHLSAGESCGGIPKEEPVVEGVWRNLAVWGVPESTEAVTVELGDGTTLEIEVRDGVALHLWEESVEITSIEFDGMTEAQREVVSSFMPIPTTDDCGRGDTSGG